MNHGLSSTETLIKESPSSLMLMKIPEFDGCLRKKSNFNSRPPDYRILSTPTLAILIETRKRCDNDDAPSVRPTKRKCLVIPDKSSHTSNPIKNKPYFTNILIMQLLSLI